MNVLSDESGTVVVEYALVLALLSIVFLTGLQLIEINAGSALSNSATEMTHYGLRDGT